MVDPGPLPCLSGKKDRGDHSSPLLRALHRGHYDVARLLLGRGAKVPDPLDLDSLLASLSHGLPDDIVEAIRANSSRGTASGSIHEGKDPVEPQHAVVSYEMAKQCEPVPSDAFAQSVVNKQTANEE